MRGRPVGGIPYGGAPPRCDDLLMAFLRAPDAPAPRAALSPVARSARAPRRPLRRRPDRGLLGGVCAGLADHLSAEVALVRLLMAMIVAVGGIGVAIYALAWALIPVAPEAEGVPRRPGAWREAVVIVLAVAGALIGLRVSGVRFGDSIVWPLVLGACGMALVWRPTVAVGGQPAPSGRESLRARVRRLGRIDGPRVAIGALLVAFASAALLHTFGVLHSLGNAIGAVAIIATVLALLFGPWFLRLARSLASERAARIREQERAEVAAHLHDSVLQTLALIQKRADDPREVAGLARRQERELRHWLLERPGRSGQETVASALERAAAEVEELHRVPIEVVTVGDGPLDGELDAIVQAAREAMTNAAKFASSERVDLYAEVEPGRVEVFVRDRGVGFDPLAIPADRRGVRDSIIGRMERHHGRAAVHSSPGAGTEVELVMERGAAA
jgi:signal transduction histidine kinase/phage shock protein PspC (stress-responsive transcriptional regulator)